MVLASLEQSAVERLPIGQNPTELPGYGTGQLALKFNGCPFKTVEFNP